MASANTENEDLSQKMTKTLFVRDGYEEVHNCDDDVSFVKSEESISYNTNINGKVLEDPDLNHSSESFGNEADVNAVVECNLENKEGASDSSYKQMSSDGSDFEDSEISDWDEDALESSMNFKRPFMHPTKSDPLAFVPSDLHANVLSTNMEVWHVVEEGQFDDADL